MGRKSKVCVEVKKQAAESVLRRDFSTDTYNQKWLTNVTEFKYGIDGKAYSGVYCLLYTES